MANQTDAYKLPPLPSYTQIPVPPLVPGIPDKYLLLILPIIAYWGLSMLFHWIDTRDLFPQYRLHTPAEVLKRNHVSRWEVVRDVVIQQIVQTAVGVLLGIMEPDAYYGKEEHDVAVWAQRIRLAQRFVPGALALFGVNGPALAAKVATSQPTIGGLLAGGIYPQSSQSLAIAGQELVLSAMTDWEILAAKAIYWVILPALQFGLAILVVDTWQYFLHRAMHMNKWLYTTFHSRHHRLYVPYAYGALYNHPFEGFLLDTCGTGLAYLVAGLTARQGMWFFTCATLKTVDDHCGYAFPWDPLQHITSNNAGYHDVHHQSWGIKTNFSQPFFTFWDRLLGTKWIGGDVSARYERARLAAQKKVDDEASRSITASGTNESKLDSSGPYEKDATSAGQIASATRMATKPGLPSGKAWKQALASRDQVLQDQEAGGASVVVEESREEERERVALSAQKRTRAKKKSLSTPSADSLKSLHSSVNKSLHGRGSGVLGMETTR